MVTAVGWWHLQCAETRWGLTNICRTHWMHVNLVMQINFYTMRGTYSIKIFIFILTLDLNIFTSFETEHEIHFHSTSAILYMSLQFFCVFTWQGFLGLTFVSEDTELMVKFGISPREGSKRGKMPYILRECRRLLQVAFCLSVTWRIFIRYHLLCGQLCCR
jgi:hypothetical protein